MRRVTRRIRQHVRRLLLPEPIPIYQGNRVGLLRDGPETFAAMLEAIQAARDTVHLETYQLLPGRTATVFAEALGRCAAAGVRVRLLYDAIGSLFCPAGYLEGLVEGGVEVAEFNPVAPWRAGRLPSRRDHRKLLVVDRQIGFAGGTNLTDDVLPVEEGGEGWRDLHIRVEGPAVVEMDRMFRETWSTSSRRRPDPPRVGPPAEVGGSLVQVVENGRLRHRRLIRRAYLRAFRAARREILITNAYFLPDGRILRALENAVRRGVRVAVILGGRSDHRFVQLACRSRYGRLLGRGIRVLEGTDRVIHAKAACVDDEWVTVGSFNMDRFSLRHNLELNVNVWDRTLGREVGRHLRWLLGSSREVDIEEWRGRGLGERLLGWLAWAFRHAL